MRSKFIGQIACIFFFTCISLLLNAQTQSRGEFRFPAVKFEDFQPTNYEIDSSANAVYLIDAGYTLIEPGKVSLFDLRERIFRRIRLLKKSSFDDLATITMKTYGYKRTQIIRLENFQASTYTYNNDKINRTAIYDSSFFRSKQGSLETIKFTFPDLKEGSIIEYSYDLVVPSLGIIPPWQFQSKYPKLASEYTIEIPSVNNLLTITNGILTANEDTVTHLNVDYMSPEHKWMFPSIKKDTADKNTTRHRWVYENVPALKKENYVSNTDDYLQSIQFYKLGMASIFSDSIDGDWQFPIDRMLNDEDFGLSLSLGNVFLNDDVRDAIGDTKDTLAKARKIYYSIKNNYTCVDDDGVYLTKTFKDVTKTKRGNVADINLLLEASLLKAGINALPVIISTRGNGKPLDTYPVIARYNYVIVVAYINGKTYLLDAADKDASFGLPANKCYNGAGRVVANPTYLLPSLSADSLTETSVTTCFFLREGGDTISGRVTTVLGNMGSIDLRNKIQETSVEDYFRELKKQYPFDVEMQEMGIDSLSAEQSENPVSVHYDVNFEPEGDVYYFNPMLNNAITENPFAATERVCPVEMPYCTDDTYIINMEIPEGYEIDELPKPARVSLNETEGMFEYLIESDEGHIQLRCRLKLNKANFFPEDYKTLRDFYAFVVEKENEQIVFKKKK